MGFSSLREGLGVGFPSLREGLGVGFLSCTTSLTHADNFLLPACCADSVMTTVSIQMMLPILFIFICKITHSRAKKGKISHFFPLSQKLFVLLHAQRIKKT